MKHIAQQYQLELGAEPFRLVGEIDRTQSEPPKPQATYPQDTAQTELPSAAADLPGAYGNAKAQAHQLCERHTIFTRKFKVMELGCSYGANHREGAELRFRGAWLRQAGFNPGASCTVTCPQAGVLEMRIDGPVQLTGQDFTAAIDRFEKLGL